MKKNIIVLVSIVASCIFVFAFLSIRYDKINDKYDVAMQNNKAYEQQLVQLQEEKKVFQFTIDQLNYVNDSSIRVMDSMRRQLNIKNNKIKMMGRLRERVFITDTISTHDTIFRDVGFVLDTTLGDEWYTNNLHL